MAMTALSEYVQYAHSPGNAWELVERPILDYQFGRFLKDRFNRIRSRASMIQTIFPKIVIPKQFSALDLGTGTGRVAARLIEYGVPAQNILGIDVEASLLRDPHFPKGVQTLQADITRFEAPLRRKFGDHRIVFDLAVASMVFHLLSYKDYVACLKTLRKHCTDRTELFVTVPHPIRDDFDSLAQYHRRSTRYERGPWGGLATYRHKTIADYMRGLRTAGFYAYQSWTTGVDEERVDGNLLIDDEASWEAILHNASVQRGDIPHKFRYCFVATVDR